MLKDRLGNGELVFGTMLKQVCNNSFSKILELAGFDYTVVDMEHGTYSIRETAGILQHLWNTSVTGIVRIPKLQYHFVARAIDVGAKGVWVPHVDTPEEARDLVKFAKHPPDGQRGAAVPYFRKKQFRECGDGANYLEEVNDEILLIVQIESDKAVGNIDEILSVDGIDVAMMGCADLSLDVGQPWLRQHSEVKKRIHKVLTSCQEHGIYFGNHLSNLEELKYWIDQGMQMVTYSNEVSMLTKEAQRALSELKVTE